MDLRYRFNPMFICESCGCSVPVLKTEFVFVPRYDKFLQVCELCSEQYHKSDDEG